MLRVCTPGPYAQNLLSWSYFVEIIKTNRHFCVKIQFLTPKLIIYNNLQIMLHVRTPGPYAQNLLSWSYFVEIIKTNRHFCVKMLFLTPKLIIYINLSIITADYVACMYPGSIRPEFTFLELFCGNY